MHIVIVYMQVTASICLEKEEERRVCCICTRGRLGDVQKEEIAKVKLVNKMVHIYRPLI